MPRNRSIHNFAPFPPHVRAHAVRAMLLTLLVRRLRATTTASTQYEWGPGARRQAKLITDCVVMVSLILTVLELSPSLVTMNRRDAPWHSSRPRAA